MKRNISYKPVLAILLLIYIGTIVLLSNIVADKVFSESENRRLEQAPSFSAAQVVDGRYTEKYEKYISDQFPLRDFWIGVKSTWEKVMGKKENNGIYLGKEGYLIEKFQEPSEEVFKSKIDEVNTITSKLSKGDIYFMLVPNSAEILKDKLPAYAPNGDQIEIINKTKDRLSNEINFVDVYDTLASHREDYIYYKTDHHWTTKGAYLAYQDLMEAMGINPHGREYFQKIKATDSFYGSLYSKSGFRKVIPDCINLYKPRFNEGIKVEYVEEEKNFDSLYHMKNLDKKDKYTIFLDGNYPYIRIRTNFSEEKKLLIIKDSYANSFIPFLTGHFSEIHIIDPRYYKEELVKLIEKEKIDNILLLYSVDTFFKH